MRQNKQNQIIFFFPDFQVGGVEKNFYIISKYLSNFFESTYLVSGNIVKNKIDKKIEIIKTGNFWSYCNRRLVFLICSIKLFIITLKLKDPIIFSFQGNFYAILISIILKKKIIVRSNLNPQAWSKSFFKSIIFRYLLSKANLVIVNSFEFQKQMKKIFKIKTEVIYNPVNIKQIKRLSHYKKKISFFQEKTINLINVGRLVDQKNQIQILSALVKLKKNIKNFRLLIIGYGPNKKNLENFINKEKINKFVKIIFVKNPYKYMKMADAFILSSKYEGLPNTLLEAACLNKYIISSNCKSGPEEILKEYEFGELYKENHTNHLYNILNKLKKNKLLNKKKDYSKNLSSFEARKNLAKYLNNINNLL